MPDENQTPQELEQPNKKYVAGRYKKADKKYEHSDGIRLIEHMEKGGSFESFAGVLEVEVATLKKWIDKNPGFKRAYDLGWPKFRLHWEKELKGATRNANASVLKMIMQNYFDWHVSDAKDIGKDKQKFTQIIMKRLDYGTIKKGSGLDSTSVGSDPGK